MGKNPHFLAMVGSSRKAVIIRKDLLKEGWEEVLEKYSIDHVVARKDKIISRFLSKVSDEWVVVKETDNAYLFSKKLIKNREKG